MQKKIAIVTLQGYSNYGNRLQNYAVQRSLEKYGFCVDSIVTARAYKSTIIKIKAYMLKVILCFEGVLQKPNAIRIKLLKSFSGNYIHERLIKSTSDKISKEISDEYDFFVVGSDQVWNPLIRQQEKDYFFLKFVEQEKRVCISPSFGVSEIPDQYIDIYLNGLNGFKYLSSREADGVRIIKNVTGREAVQLIDPTLALTREEWLKLVPTNIEFNIPYIMVCFLGNITDECKDIIENTAKKEQLNIINLFSKAYSVEETLALIRDAKLVCTDSFHFTAFSINFNTPFYVFRRNGVQESAKMFSRLSSLTELFGLENRIYDNRKILNIECDFEMANLELIKQRKIYYHYLEKVLNINCHNVNIDS